MQRKVCVCVCVRKGRSGLLVSRLIFLFFSPLTILLINNACVSVCPTSLSLSLSLWQSVILFLTLSFQIFFLSLLPFPHLISIHAFGKPFLEDLQVCAPEIRDHGRTLSLARAQSMCVCVCVCVCVRACVREREKEEIDQLRNTPSHCKPNKLHPPKAGR